MIIELKRDKYRAARGRSRILNLHCRICGNKILTYQKDGPGNLRRLYLDRIFHPKTLANLQSKNLGKIPVLKCSKCKEELGTPYIFKKENRKAFRLYQDALVSKR